MACRGDHGEHYVWCGIGGTLKMFVLSNPVHRILSCPSVANVYWTDAMTRVPSCMLIKISSAG